MVSHNKVINDLKELWRSQEIEEDEIKTRLKE